MMLTAGSLSRRSLIAHSVSLPAGSYSAPLSSTEEKDLYRPQKYGAFSASDREPDIVVPLWNAGQLPGGAVPPITESVDDQWDIAGFRYRVAVQVTRPTLSYFAPRRPSGAAILIIPGGGYSRVGIDREGYESARWCASLGLAAFVLRYRLPVDRWAVGADVALQDAQRAMRLIRAGVSGRWSVDPRRVTVMGGSAGGHLAGMLCTKVYDRTYQEVDAADRLATRPDGAILLYPVVSMDNGAHVGSRSALLGSDPTPASVAKWSLDGALPGITPPMMVVHAMHDRVVPVDHSLALLRSVRACGGAIDLHLFEEGAHGVGLRGDPRWPMSDWPDLAQRWMERNALL